MSDGNHEQPKQADHIAESIEKTGGLTELEPDYRATERFMADSEYRLRLDRVIARLRRKAEADPGFAESLRLLADLLDEQDEGESNSPGTPWVSPDRW